MPESVKKYIIIILSVAIFAVVVFIFLNRKDLSRLVPKKFKADFSNFQSALLKSINIQTIPAIILLTIFTWTLEFSTFYLITKSIGLDISFYLVMLIVIMANAIMTVPITPSGLGFVEAGVAGTLLLVGVDKNIAISVAILNNIINYWNQLVFGFICYITSKKS